MAWIGQPHWVLSSILGSINQCFVLLQHSSKLQQFGKCSCCSSDSHIVQSLLIPSFVNFTLKHWETFENSLQKSQTTSNQVQGLIKALLSHLTLQNTLKVGHSVPVKPKWFWIVSSFHSSLRTWVSISSLMSDQIKKIKKSCTTFSQDCWNYFSLSVSKQSVGFRQLKWWRKH